VETPSRRYAGPNILYVRRLRLPTDIEPYRSQVLRNTSATLHSCTIASQLDALGFRLHIAQHTALDLIFLNGLEQGLEIALAEAVITLSLNKLEENRSDYGF
jgi:hypothetical protein